MATMNLAALVESLDAPAREALEAAAGACASRGGYEIGIEEYFTALLNQPDMQDVLTQFERSAERVRELLEQSRPQQERRSDRPVFSPLLIEFLQEAYLLASLELRLEKVSVGILVLALLSNPNRYGVLPFFKELGQISADGLRRLLEGLHAGETSHAKAAAGGSGENALQKYGTDFTAEAKAGRIDPVFARGPEIRQMIDILTRRRKNNPILVGDPGVGKTAVVEGLALKVAEGDVPEALAGVRIVWLDMGRLQAGASVKGEFEKRLKAVIEEVKGASTPTILFIDEAHSLVGSGNASGSGDGANLLKPALARGEMRTIAATTWGEYKKYFEKDAALARRFQLVSLKEPSLEETVLILRGIVPHYEKTHQVYVRDDAVMRTAELAGRYISGRQLPDKAIDVLDTACARVRVSLGAKPPELEALEEKQAALRRELDAFERDQCRGIHGPQHSEDGMRHAAMQAEFAGLNERIIVLTERWQREKQLVEHIVRLRTTQGTEGARDNEAETQQSEALQTGPSLEALLNQLHDLQRNDPLVFFEVSPELVTGIVAEWTGIPESKLSGIDATLITGIGERLRRRIRGQDHALASVEKAIMAAHAGLDNPGRPNGIFLLVGPSGVGKTETALAVADELFGGERMLISINMSEFQEKHTVSRLIGSPPGYVGYGEGGRLTEAVRRQPYSAVLFDEVEKAHPDILNLFYQVFDKGILADGEGREVDFRNTMIFMTANLGSDIVTALCEEEEPPTPEVIKEALLPALQNFFRPALLGRMTVVPYTTIRPEILKELVQIKLKQVAERLLHRHHIHLDWAGDVVENIASSCQAVDTGARNIDHILNATLLPGIATALLAALTEQAQQSTTLHIALHAETGGYSYAWSE
ncbi:MAG: type VI secretion system ATPase TssH [Betaproteobacteria bacterium]|nr:type VI secretion system ATPase TssH [Betaproteobacteria bacterium]